MWPRVSARFLIGFALAVIGAFMTIGVLIDVRPPVLRTSMAVALFVVGAHLVHTALDRDA